MSQGSRRPEKRIKSGDDVAKWEKSDAYSVRNKREKLEIPLIS